MPSLPRALLSHAIASGEILPRYLGASDGPWLRALLEERRRHDGERERAWHARLAGGWRVPAPRQPLRMAAHVLEQVVRGPRRRLGPRPSHVRTEVFVAAAQRPDQPMWALGRAASALGIPTEQVAAALFDDLPGERRLGCVPDDLSPGGLARHTNLALVQGLLRSASSVRIEAEGRAGAVVRAARVQGLLCTVQSSRDDLSEATLDVSGPFGLFRRTRLYGRALGALVPALSWCDRYRLVADCTLGRQRLVLRVGTGDPVLQSGEPRRYDSAAEARFARDFGRATRAWDLVREPAPVRVLDALVLPDFLLVHREDPERRWWLEIVGFWTPEYLAKKLARLRAAGLRRLVLCVDSSLACADGDLPTDAHVVRYRRRVPADEVLRIVEPP